MTRNDFIHHAAIALYGRDDSREELIARSAAELANEVSEIAPFDEEIVPTKHYRIDFDNMTEKELKEIQSHKLEETYDVIIGHPLVL